jgi:hypothetical protein
MIKQTDFNSSENNLHIFVIWMKMSCWKLLRFTLKKIF